MIGQPRSPGILLPIRQISTPSSLVIGGDSAPILTDPASFDEALAIFDASDRDTVLDATFSPTDFETVAAFWKDQISSPTQLLMGCSSSSYRPYIYRGWEGGMIEWNNDKYDIVGAGWPGNFSTNAFTAVAIISFTSNIAIQSLFDGQSAVTMLVRIAADGVVRMGSGGSSWDSTKKITPTGSKAYICVFRFNGSSSQMWFSPTDYTYEAWTETGETGTNTISALKIGCDGAGANRLRSSGFYYFGMIGKALSDSEVNEVGRWMADHTFDDSSDWRFS